MCARMVWVYDEAKGIWVRRVVYTPEAEWELEGIEEYRLPQTYYNVTPTYNCAILRVADHKLRFERARWGIRGGKGMGHNAKAENLRRVPLWRDLWMRHHAIVVADGFYEWDETGGKRQPYYFHRKDGQPLAIAGLYRPPEATHDEEDRPEVTIITSPPNDLLARYHDRMPVVLEPEAVRAWLRPETHDEEEIKALLAPAGDVLTTHPVTPDVNKSTNSRPDLIEPYRIPGGAQERLF